MGQNVPRGFVVARSGLAESPETPERQEVSLRAETVGPVLPGVVWEGLLESQGEGSGWYGAEMKSQKSSAASRWVPSVFPPPRGNLALETVQQGEWRGVDPS